jgi:hypothetical protein
MSDPRTAEFAAGGSAVFYAPREAHPMRLFVLNLWIRWCEMRGWWRRTRETLTMSADWRIRHL